MKLSIEEQKILELYRQSPFRIIKLYNTISDPQEEAEPVASPEKEHETLK